MKVFLAPLSKVYGVYISQLICFGGICSNASEIDNRNKKVSEYDQEIPQSHTADQPTAT